MKVVRTLLVIAGIALVLGVANYNIRSYQQIVDSGRVVLLELRPVDPRSLIQGDYMQLRYAAGAFPTKAIENTLPRRGSFVLSLDEHDVGTYSRVDDGTALAQDEVRLQYKLTSEYTDPSIGAETFNFEEGQAAALAGAVYGVLRVDDTGRSVLVGLADEQHQRITP